MKTKTILLMAMTVNIMCVAAFILPMIKVVVPEIQIANRPAQRGQVKVIEETMNDEDTRWDSRVLISFEEDAAADAENSDSLMSAVTDWLEILLLLLAFASIIAALVFLLSYNRVHIKPVMNSPEQHAQVKVAGKRIQEDRSDNGVDECIVAFKFPDNSIKELKVGQIYSTKRYDAIRVGDTGMLYYKERADLENKIKNEDRHYNGRHFVCFVKDPASDT
ncbi:MAG: hypothetical protein LBS36_02065 [Oscillospiraceae bacterium]|nr:hypothetical protein [Oscillospiraceae bacterium]